MSDTADEDRVEVVAGERSAGSFWARLLRPRSWRRLPKRWDRLSAQDQADLANHTFRSGL